MDRMEVVCYRSDIVNSAKDLGEFWNANDYQRSRVKAVIDVVGRCLVTHELVVELEGRTLLSAYEAACEHIGKEPQAFAVQSIALAENICARGSSIEERMELVSFFNLLKDSYSQVLGR